VGGGGKGRGCARKGNAGEASGMCKGGQDGTSWRAPEAWQLGRSQHQQASSVGRCRNHNQKTKGVMRCHK
jgi:hypothetical protein